MATEDYWGYLIKEDKSPAPVFEQLLLGIANYIVRQTPPSLYAVVNRADKAAESTDRTLGHPMPDTGQACSLLPTRWR